jgi:hypothetical protein
MGWAGPKHVRGASSSVDASLAMDASTVGARIVLHCRII